MTNRFNPDGDCKRWCIHEALSFFGLPTLDNEELAVAAPILSRKKMFSERGFETHIYVPPSLLLIPRFFIARITARAELTISNNAFIRLCNVIFDKSPKACVFLEAEAEVIYALQEPWSHTVLITVENKEKTIRDGLRPILERDNLIPQRSETWYFDRLTSPRCAKLLVWESP
jgi:hypothetical protein